MPPQPSRRLLIAHLEQEIQKRSERAGGAAEWAFVSMPWGRMGMGAVHEWFADSPPLCILSAITRAANPDTGKCLVWIGRVCRPFPTLLIDHQSGDRTALRCSVFVDLTRRQLDARIWAIDLALRCPAVSAVIADGRGIDRAASRRLQLAAESSQSILLAWRPMHERQVLSAAHYRWQATHARAPTHRPRWSIEQLRCKDAFSPRDGVRVQPCLVERDDATGRIAVPAEVVDRSRSTTPARDYFKVQDEQGRWIWLYRELESRRWFVHGVWA